jgi:hypothetical protein
MFRATAHANRRCWAAQPGNRDGSGGNEAVGPRALWQLWFIFATEQEFGLRKGIWVKPQSAPPGRSRKLPKSATTESAQYGQVVNDSFPQAILVVVALIQVA